MYHMKKIILRINIIVVVSKLISESLKLDFGHQQSYTRKTFRST